MQTMQNNCCAICGKTFSIIAKPRVDHDHRTGKVRGLLFNNCNVILGLANDDISVLKKAIDYLVMNNGFVT
jgi:hypothetical protein